MVYIWYSSQPSQKVFCSKYWCVQLYALKILIFSSAAWLTALDLIFLLMAQLKMLHQPAILCSVDADWRQHRVWVNDVWKANWNPLENENDLKQPSSIQKSYANSGLGVKIVTSDGSKCGGLFSFVVSATVGDPTFGHRSRFSSFLAGVPGWLSRTLPITHHIPTLFTNLSTFALALKYQKISKLKTTYWFNYVF